ncbi:MAG: amidohydrolase family protein [Acidimicrobiales bacterium]|nr:amidohydrolase family protein [Acidimicrobiales bacterium]
MRVDLLGVSDDLGTIEVGKLADLVVWDGFDLDVSDRRLRIYTVVQDGAVVAGRFSNSIQFPSAP